MHPAYSVIFFTTASGAGYGLLFWLMLATMLGRLPEGRWTPFVALCLALILITAGLLASTTHLGRPERAWRAISQWRSSWLSREGIAALATYPPAGLVALAWLFDNPAPALPIFAAFAAIAAAVTVVCTGMIYASLPTIRHWHQPHVPILYLVLAAATGAVLLAALAAVSGSTFHLWAWLALASLGLGAAVKLAYFLRIDADPGRYTAGAALGFAANTQVRPLDPPHTRPNFVMREMGYQVGRRHAQRLRRIMWAALFAAPAGLVGVTLFWPGATPLLLLAAVASAAAGVLVERWLFFAEAEHVAMLYYGRHRA